MKRETSNNVYFQILSEGLLSGVRLAIYRELYISGAATTSELSKELNIPRVTISPRLSEMKAMNIVKELDSPRYCSVTGRRCIAWDLTKELPVKKSKQKTDNVKCPTCNGKGTVKQGRLF